MDRPEDIGWGLVDWGTVVAHWPYGLDVFLDSSGEVGTVDRVRVNDSRVRCNEEYWPDVGTVSGCVAWMCAPAGSCA